MQKCSMLFGEVDRNYMHARGEKANFQQGKNRGTLSQLPTGTALKIHILPHILF